VSTRKASGQLREISFPAVSSANLHVASARSRRSDSASSMAEGLDAKVDAVFM
jgi:hypothetical protein